MCKKNLILVASLVLMPFMRSMSTKGEVQKSTSSSTSTPAPTLLVRAIGKPKSFRYETLSKRPWDNVIEPRESALTPKEGCIYVSVEVVVQGEGEIAFKDSSLVLVDSTGMEYIPFGASTLWKGVLAKVFEKDPFKSEANSLSGNEKVSFRRDERGKPVDVSLKGDGAACMFYFEVPQGHEGMDLKTPNGQVTPLSASWEIMPKPTSRPATQPVRGDNVKQSTIYTDKNNHFRVCPPEGWEKKEFDDPRSKVEFYVPLLVGTNRKASLFFLSESISVISPTGTVDIPKECENRVDRLKKIGAQDARFKLIDFCGEKTAQIDATLPQQSIRMHSLWFTKYERSYTISFTTSPEFYKQYLSTVEKALATFRCIPPTDKEEVSKEEQDKILMEQIRVLITSLDDPDMGKDAEASLLRLGDTAIPTLTEITKTGTPQQKEQAKRILHKIKGALADSGDSKKSPESPETNVPVILSGSAKIDKRILASNWDFYIDTIEYGLRKVTYIEPASISSAKDEQFIIIHGKLNPNKESDLYVLHLKSFKLLISPNNSFPMWIKAEVSDNTTYMIIWPRGEWKFKASELPIKVSLYYKMPISIKVFEISLDDSKPLLLFDLTKHTIKQEDKGLQKSKDQ